MTRVHAYLARIKEQDVIAVPDGAGRALCVSSDKHWTLTREWDELHIIAPLVEENAEARTAPAVTRDDIEKAIRGKVWAANRDPNKAGFHRVHIAWATDSVWSLVSGADPAVHVVRESDLPTVRQDDDGEWYPEGRWDLADDRFIDVEGALEKMHRYAAIARAIEAREDPIMVRTRELLDLAYPGEYVWTGAFETCRKIAEAEARLEGDSNA